jgi:hypothetical protein
MRRHRARRRAGFWSISVEIGEADVRGLIQLGFLDRLERDDQGAVGAAHTRHLTGDAAHYSTLWH